MRVLPHTSPPARRPRRGSHSLAQLENGRQEPAVRLGDGCATMAPAARRSAPPLGGLK
jgi:hypothetical protein